MAKRWDSSKNYEDRLVFEYTDSSRTFKKRNDSLDVIDVSCSRNCASLCFAVSEAVELFCFQILAGVLRYHKRDELEGP